MEINHEDPLKCSPKRNTAPRAKTHVECKSIKNSCDIHWWDRMSCVSKPISVNNKMIDDTNGTTWTYLGHGPEWHDVRSHRRAVWIPPLYGHWTFAAVVNVHAYALVVCVQDVLTLAVSTIHTSGGTVASALEITTLVWCTVVWYQSHVPIWETLTTVCI